MRESDLDLDSLTLKGLDLQMGTGKSTVDLTGNSVRTKEEWSWSCGVRGGRGGCGLVTSSAATADRVASELHPRLLEPFALALGA